MEDKTRRICALRYLVEDKAEKQGWTRIHYKQDTELRGRTEEVGNSVGGCLGHILGAGMNTLHTQLE